MNPTVLQYTHNGQTTIINLPSDLNWEDEFKWYSVTQSQEYAIQGAIIVDNWAKNSGRPITLKGGEDRAWVLKSDILALQILANLPEQFITLTLSDGRAFRVLLDHSSGPCFEAHEIWNSFPHDTTSTFVLSYIKFIEMPD